MVLGVGCVVISDACKAVQDGLPHATLTEVFKTFMRDTTLAERCIFQPHWQLFLSCLSDLGFYKPSLGQNQSYGNSFHMHILWITLIFHFSNLIVSHYRNFLTCLHSDFSKKGWHLTNFTFFCARALFTSVCVNQNPNKWVVWRVGVVLLLYMWFKMHS